jgi:hypothetical protein
MVMFVGFRRATMKITIGGNNVFLWLTVGAKPKKIFLVRIVF